MKEVDIDQVIADLPNLSLLHPTARSGPFSGCQYKVEWNGRWSTHRAGEDLDLAGVTRDDVELSCELGTLTLSKPVVTRHEFPSGEVEGSTVAVHLDAECPAGDVPLTFRTYVRVEPTSWGHVLFPDSIEYTGSRGGGARALLPLKAETFDLDVYWLREGPYLIFESTRGGLTLDSFRRLSGAARQLFSYLTGERCDRDSCDLVLAGGRLVEAWWYQGRTNEDSLYHPIPVTLSEAYLAAGSPKGRSIPPPLEPSAVARCLACVLEQPALVAPIEYLLHFANLPVELRGAFLSIALESLTAHLQRQGLVDAPAAIGADAWAALRVRLKHALQEESEKWNVTDREKLKLVEARLDNLNSPTNQDKLLRAFKALGIALTPEEETAIARRNIYLHRGRLLAPEDVSSNPESWRGAYDVEMKIYTAVNRLLLKYLGYAGPVIDWGKTSTGGGEMAFTTI